MAYVAILLITILVMFIIVRIGGFALEITGIEPDVARFQALSAFSGTGFTTAETERVVRNRTRRRVVTILIILGNVGMVTLIATMVASFTQDTGLMWFFIRLAIIITGILVLYSLIIRSRVGTQILDRFRKPLLKRIISEAPAIDEIYLIGRYWSISLVTIKKDSKNLGLSLADVVMGKEIQILEIERAGSNLTCPDSLCQIMEWDRLLVYGKRQDIKRLFG
ncbi:hypothetical protein ACFLTQ_00310 [Chloroflexota bacterium]